MRTAAIISLAAITISLAGCRREGCTDPNALNYNEKAKKDNGLCVYKAPGYDVPETYSFDNVSYSGQTERLNMLDEMVAYMKTGNTSGTVLSATKLNEMYENTGGHFTFTSSKQLRDKTYAPDQSKFVALFDSIAIASQSSVPASNGTAGVITSNDGTKKYLVDANGRELTQLIEKGLMGAVIYYQITGNYLTDDKIGNGVDNSTITPGEGTPMEHHWDEAFGYFGVPVDFPANLNGLRYLGKYTNSREGVMDVNAPLMNAYIKGRAAISNEDYTTRDEQVVIIRETLEKVAAATAISYLNKAKSHLADDALRNHELSEAVTFIEMLKYSPVKKITATEISTALGHIGHNFYNVSAQGIEDAKTVISNVYGLNDIKDTL